MTAVKLPIYESPIRGRLHLTYPLAILLNYKECWDWFHSNYIQLVCQKQLTHETLNLMFYLPDAIEWRFNYIWLERKIINPKLLVRSNIDVNELIMDHIDQGYYSKIELNDYYLPNKPEYLKVNKTHLNFIYGYSNNSEFYTLGFNKGSSYGESTITFSQLTDAYYNNHSYEHSHFGDIYFFKKSERVSYEIDMNNIKEQLQDYISSRNSSKKYTVIHNAENEQVFGMAIYNCLLDYIDCLSKEDIHYDIRNFHILWEHKVCMIARLEYLIQKGYLVASNEIITQYKDIERSTLILRNLMLKFSSSKDVSILEKVKVRILDIMLKEKELILYLLAQMP